MKRLLLLLMLLALPSVALAQTNCGNGLPCGPLPWGLPNFPSLTTPTPVPTATQVEYSGNVAFPTPTPVPDSELIFDTGDLGNQIATISALYTTTPFAIGNIDGSFNATPRSPLESFIAIANDSSNALGYVKGLSYANLGVITPLFQIFLFSIGWYVFWRIFPMLIRLFATLVGIIRTIIEFILEFIPF